MQQTESRLMTGEDHVRATGLMMKLLGGVIEQSAGNAEHDFEAWLVACRDAGIENDRDRLRVWFRSTLVGAGITS